MASMQSWHQAPHDPHEQAEIERLRVVVVGEDVLQRRRVAEAMRADGYRVDEIGVNGGALNSVDPFCQQTDRPDLLVIETSRCAERAVDLLSAVRRLDGSLSMVLIADVGDQELVDSAASRFGALATFTRPFELDDLRTAVMTFAGLRRAKGSSRP